MTGAAGGIRIGTSGWSFRDWVGPFYPPGTRAADFLEFYARHFAVAEVNATYYRIPSARSFAGMADRTPPGFRFVVKLHASATHERAPAPELDRGFLAAIEPLRVAGKLDGLLAQFPGSFRRDDAAKRHLEQLRQRFPGDPLWVEFRHISWMHAHLPDWLHERGLGYCAVDEPALPGLVPPRAWVTNAMGYVRFHGRNAATWWQGGGERYDWDYSGAELSEWLARIGEMARQARQTYLFFNNCHAGQAARSAKLMQELLRRQSLPL